MYTQAIAKKGSHSKIRECPHEVYNAKKVQNVLNHGAVQKRSATKVKKSYKRTNRNVSVKGPSSVCLRGVAAHLWPFYSEADWRNSMTFLKGTGQG